MAAVAENEKHAQAAIAIFSPKPPPDLGVTWYVEEQLKGAAFCGHVQTDLDSIAGAVGGALLYGGFAVRASEVNSETSFALDYWKVDVPPAVEGVIEANAATKVCLVDHQQTSQINPAIMKNPGNIVGCIDHHALQNSTVVTVRASNHEYSSSARAERL